MKLLGRGFYFEDFPVGFQFRTVGRTVTDADITNFINCVGLTEVIFTDQEYLRTEMNMDRRLAPGALVYSFAEAFHVPLFQLTAIAFLGMELAVLAPVFSGDTVHVEAEIIEARASKSRPDRGILKARNRVLKQDGTVAMVYTPTRMIKREPARSEGSAA